MLHRHRIVRESARQIAEAVNRVVAGYRIGRIEHEPAFTDRMLGHIEEAMDNLHVRELVWSSKTLTGTVRNSQESEFGADFLGTLDIDLDDYQTKKGFLAQAKITKKLNRSELERLRHQCHQMLDYTTDAFVFLYDEIEVRVVPARAVVGTDLHPSELYSRSVQSFFEDHFECFIGDQQITSATPDQLDELRTRFNARSLLYLGLEWPN